jgi:diguanylate cyclase (GGDEF)-like protein
MKLLPKNPWHWVWIAILCAVALTALLNVVQSLIWYGEISPALMIVGTIDSGVVALLVAPAIVYFVLSERRRVEDELRLLSLMDELTGVNNRRGFFLLAEQFRKLAIRHRTGMYLMYVDVDDFKTINDAHGHERGDQTLQDFAELLRTNFRASDVIARLGGDEFVVFPVGTTREGVDIMMDRFRSSLEHYNDTVEESLRLRVSVGLSYFDPDAPCTLDDLVREADESMYAEKRRRKEEEAGES